MGNISAAILPAARLTRTYAETLLKGINPADFARLPKGINTNHPAWVYGHLAVYPDMLLEMLGRKDLTKPNPKFKELFENGKPCLDDPNASIYPAMEVITSTYFERTDAAINALAEADDAALNAPVTDNWKSFATVGSRFDFLLGGHSMMHLGQISAWRRIMGLPAAM
ncbi:MAG: DinB family protein [Phycisphaerales bacterium]